jgi:hypothetical protein
MSVEREKMLDKPNELLSFGAWSFDNILTESVLGGVLKVKAAITTAPAIGG